MPDRSFIGFFSPEKFESLKGHISFDGIWDMISDSINDGEHQVYMVSWNDHFFILKIESNACHIIDTLGERLFEGCSQAYTTMYLLQSRSQKMRRIVLTFNQNSKNRK
uniref:Uncharacterized protein n=1 Tax=Nelumbo nucifera TaxID=4432 RepID=A0A822ZXV5_NELNU|nr:TPA_asm: hypothetical protein HUJ06_018298 [Nelumbo nucifera]